jgi:hypothetical protein
MKKSMIIGVAVMAIVLSGCAMMPTSNQAGKAASGNVSVSGDVNVGVMHRKGF